MSPRTFALLLAAGLAVVPACSSRNVKPQEADAHYRIALSYLMRQGGYFDERNRRAAFPEIEQAIALNGENFNYHQTLGDLLLLENDVVRAEQAFTKAANLAPDRPEPLVGLGNLFLRQSRPKEAVKYYLMVLQYRSYPTPEIVHYNLGRAYAMDGDFAKALESLQRAAELVPLSDGVHFQIGLTLAEMGLSAGAEKAFKRVLEISPGSSQAHYQLGLLYMKDRRFPEARSAFSEVVRLEKNGELKDRAQRYLSVLQ